jgi:Skp family chaperone for outer membrane proteins
MLIRLSLIVAIVAALAAGVVNFAVVKGKIDKLTADRNDQRSQKDDFHRKLTSTQKTLKDTVATLDQTKKDLDVAKADEQKAEDNLTAANTKIDDLTGRLTKTTAQRDDAQNQLAAYKATGLTPPQVDDLNKNLKQTEMALDVANQENLVLTHTVASLNNKINELVGTNYVVALPSGLKGTVMAVDPKWDFVVLNVGEDQGVLKDGEMLVSRDGKLVAKVIVRSVQKDRSIANLVPGWQLGEIIEGDEVIPAHPAS